MEQSLTELLNAGLITAIEDPHLSDKGREWMHLLENVDHRVIDEDAAADLVLSTNGLFR